MEIFRESISEIILNVVEYFIQFYTGSKIGFDELDFNSKKKIEALVSDGLSKGALGEFIASVNLIKNNYFIHWTNLIIKQPGNAESHGADMLVSKKNNWFFIEVKTNYKNSTRATFSIAKSQACKELKLRLNKPDIYINRMEGIKNIGNSEEEMNKIYKNVYGKAVIVTQLEKNELPSPIKEEFDIIAILVKNLIKNILEIRNNLEREIKNK